MIQISNLSKKYGETVVFSDLNYMADVFLQ